VALAAPPFHPPLRPDIAPRPPPPEPPPEPVVEEVQVFAAPPLPEVLPDCPPPRPPEEAPEVLFVLDASESMLLPYPLPPGSDDELNYLMGQGGFMAQQARMIFESLVMQPGPKRIDRAKDAVIAAIQEAPADVEIGMVIFQSCSDIQNYGYYSAGERGSLIRVVDNTRTGAGTPLADSMAEAGNLIVGGRSSADPAYMVLLTDGDDSCHGDPCMVASMLKSRFPGLIINVVDLSGDAQIQCVADITGGRLVRPEGGESLPDVVRRAAGQPDLPAHCLPAN
jgi:hypothetical protein